MLLQRWTLLAIPCYCTQVQLLSIGLLLQIKSMIQSNLHTAEVTQEAAG